MSIARPAGQILEVLADEVADMASVAKSIDRTVCDLDLSHKLGLHGRTLQRVDLLWQHLEDVALVLQRLSELMEQAPEVDPVDLGQSARLDFMRRRLHATGSRHEKQHNPGHVDLF